MDEQALLATATVTPADVPPSPPKSPIPRTWLVAGGVIAAGLIALTILNKLLSAPTPPTAQVVEAPTPTPTPVRILSSIATQSAFMALENSQASLSANLNSANLDDPILSPPVLTLPLGFRQ